MRLPAASPIALAPSAATPRADIEKAARELETQFARMLIKSMRSASMGDSMFGGNSTYRDMYDQQLATELGKGRGLGLAPMIVRQLGQDNGATAPGDATAQTAFPLRMPGTAAPAMPMPLAMPATGPLPLVPSSSGVSMPAFDAPGLPAPVPAPQAAVDCADIPLDCSSPEAFVQSNWPQAQKTAAELGVPAKALVAQAALETGWGRRLAGRAGVSSQNLFGIKAGGRWNGERVNSATHEFVAGVRRSERADFRAYASATESFEDYARLLGNPRYAAARNAGNDTHRFASALQQAGYATDPNYAAKITAIANGATLNRALAAMPSALPSGPAVYASNAVATARE
jgi:flagellar protein FlgJ